MLTYRWSGAGQSCREQGEKRGQRPKCASSVGPWPVDYSWCQLCWPRRVAAVWVQNAAAGVFIITSFYFNYQCTKKIGQEKEDHFGEGGSIINWSNPVLANTQVKEKAGLWRIARTGSARWKQEWKTGWSTISARYRKRLQSGWQAVRIGPRKVNADRMVHSQRKIKTLQGRKRKEQSETQIRPRNYIEIK